MKTVLNVKTDPKIKKEAQKLAKELGLPMSIVVTQLLRQFIADGDLVFENQKRPKQKVYRMSKKLEKIIGEIEEDRKHRRNFSGPFETAEEMFKHIKSNK